jgi:hypothetical protein
MAETPFQLLVATICGLICSHRWRLGHSPSLLQQETGHTAEEIASAIPKAVRQAKAGLGGELGANSLRADLGLFSRYIQAEARSQKLDLSELHQREPWHPWKDDEAATREALAVAFRHLGGVSSGDLQNDVIAVVTRAEQILGRGTELGPEVLRALWCIAVRGSALEWTEHKARKEEAEKGSAG